MTNLLSFVWLALSVIRMVTSAFSLVVVVVETSTVSVSWLPDWSTVYLMFSQMQIYFTIVLFAEHFTNNLFEFISDGAVDQKVY